MALVESIDIKINTRMPDFHLDDPEGKLVTSKELLKHKGLAIFFTCNHCPYAKAIWPRIIRSYLELYKEGIGFVAINSNINPMYPDDSPEKMKEKIQEWEIPFPYLIDKSQNTAKQYQAQCTPDIFLLDEKMNLVYHGRFDDNWKDEKNVHQQDFKMAALNLIEGEDIALKQYPSLGCSIKWT
ncbi:thioredoxin family protein [bacterium]|jgi:peroxiredoxin|nr:thioredoxin family protein [bacterium]